MKNDISAFPAVDADHVYTYGMTLRDYFAAKAMEGAIFGAMKTWSWIPEAQHRRLATESYKLADAMLAAREETK